MKYSKHSSKLVEPPLERMINQDDYFAISRKLSAILEGDLSLDSELGKTMPFRIVSFNNPTNQNFTR
jgi:hypothetical protein